MIAVLVSGTGRSLLNLIEQGYSKQIAFVGTQNTNCGGAKIAVKHGLPVFDFVPEAASETVFGEATVFRIKLIVLAGYTAKLPIPDGFVNRVINIHPSLLPSFGGKGMYGMNVHKAVIDSGVKFSGCTVHYVNNEYDKGPIILQRLVPVFDEDDPETLAKKVFEEEKIALPLAIDLHLKGKLKPKGNRVFWQD